MLLLVEIQQIVLFHTVPLTFSYNYTIILSIPYESTITDDIIAHKVLEIACYGTSSQKVNKWNIGGGSTNNAW